MRRPKPAAEMPFLDHLEELRVRLFWIIGALFIGVMVGFFLLQRYDLIHYLMEPAQPYLTTGKLQVLHPADTFTIMLTLAIWMGIVMASPIILYQLWGFVSPALYANERRVGGYVLAGGLLLFVGGAALAFFFVLPASLKFFVLVGHGEFDIAYTARDYFNLLTTMVLTFGVAFELPIVIVALTALGLVTPSFLRAYRRHAFVLCVVGGAFVTPGDAIAATFAMIVPLYFLYELGIVLSARVYRWRERRDSTEDADRADDKDRSDRGAGAPASV